MPCRISKYMHQKKLRITMKAFASSQFAYSPLIWMFHSRQINHKINKIHERVLTIVYSYFSSFEELLLKTNLSQFIKEIYKYLLLRCTKYDMDYPQILCKTFLKLKVTAIILVMHQHFPQEILKQLDIDYKPSLTWLVPKEMKQITTLNELKAKIKIWKLENCHCRLCRT